MRIFLVSPSNPYFGQLKLLHPYRFVNWTKRSQDLLLQIFNTANRLFLILTVWARTPKRALSKRQIELLCQLKHDTLFNLKKSRSKIQKNATISDGSLHLKHYSTISKPQRPSVYDNVTFDPSLQEMRNFIHHTVDNSYDLLTEKYIDPLISSYPNVHPDMLRSVKWICSWVIKIGAEAKHPLFNKLSEHHQEVSRHFLDSSLDKTLDWLAGENSTENRQLIEDALRRRLSQLDNQQEGSLLNNPNLNQWIQSCLNWCFDTPRADFTHYFSQQPSQRILNNLNQSLVFALIEKKVETYGSQLEDLILHTLQRSLLPELKFSILEITDEVSGRAAEILSCIDMRDIFSALTCRLDQHVTHYLDAKHQAARDFDERAGGRGTDEERHAFIEEQLKNHFLNHAHEFVKQAVIDKPDDADPIRWKRSIEKNIIEQLAKDLISLFLPKKTIVVEGELKDVDAIEYFVKRFPLPENVRNVIDEVEQFATQFLPVQGEHISKFKNVAGDFVRSIGLDLTRAVMNNYFSLILREIFQELTNEEKLKKLIGNSILPSYTTLLLESLTEKTFILEIESYREDLFQIRCCQSTKAVKRRMRKRLFQQVRAHFNKFQLRDANLTKQSFCENVINPLLREYTTILRDKNFLHIQPIPLLRSRYNEEPIRPNNTYANLVNRIVFDIGELSGSLTRYFAEFLHKQINESVGRTFNKINSSQYAILDMALKALWKEAGTKHDLKKRLFPKTPGINQNDFLYDRNLTTIAAIIYDLSNLTIARDSYAAYLPAPIRNILVQQVIDSEPTHLKNVIDRIVTRLFGDYTLSADFIWRVHDIAKSKLNDCQQRLVTTSRI